MAGKITTTVGPYLPSAGRLLMNLPSAGRLLMNKLILSKDPHLVENIESLPLEVRRGVNELEWMFEPKAEDRARIVAAFPHLHRSRISTKVQRDVLPNETLINIFSCLGTREIARVKSISWRWCCNANTTMNRRVGQPTMDLCDLVEAAPFYDCRNSGYDPFFRNISAMSPYCKLRKLIFSGSSNSVRLFKTLTPRATKGITALEVRDSVDNENLKEVLSFLPNLETLTLNNLNIEVPFILRCCKRLTKITVEHDIKLINSADFQRLKEKNLAIDLAGEEIGFDTLAKLARKVTPGMEELHFGTLSSYCPTLRKICIHVIQADPIDQLNRLQTLSFGVREQITTIKYDIDYVGVDHHAILRSLIPLFPNLSTVQFEGFLGDSPHLRFYTNGAFVYTNGTFNDETLLFLANTCKQLKEVNYCSRHDSTLFTRVSSETLNILREKFPTLAINLRMDNSTWTHDYRIESAPSVTDIESLLNFARIYDHSINPLDHSIPHDLSKIAPFLGKVTRLKIKYSVDFGKIHVPGGASFATLPPSIRNNIQHLLVFSSYIKREELLHLLAWRTALFPNAVIQTISPRLFFN